jgi:hypothetical protein
LSIRQYADNYTYEDKIKELVIVSIGGERVGKSTVSNFLIDGFDSGMFK